MKNSVEERPNYSTTSLKALLMKESVVTEAIKMEVRDDENKVMIIAAAISP